MTLAGNWQINDDKGEYSFAGDVPGTVQGDLVQRGLVPHPYVGTNETAMRDLENKSWTYVREFELDDLLAEENVELVFEGVDTLSDIRLNGRYLGSTEDMFLEYRFDVKDVLNTGKNILEVHIKSPVTEARALERVYGKMGAAEESIRTYIRKAQYSYGWDWGIRLPTSGIWRPVYIESYSRARLTGCTAYLEERRDADGIVRVSGRVASGADPCDPRKCSVEVRVMALSSQSFP